MRAPSGKNSNEVRGSSERRTTCGGAPPPAARSTKDTVELCEQKANASPVGEKATLRTHPALSTS